MEGHKPRFRCVGPNPRILLHEQVGVDNLIHEGYSTVNFLQKESIMPCSSHRISILVLQVTSLLAMVCLTANTPHSWNCTEIASSWKQAVNSTIGHSPLPKDASCMPDGSLDTTGTD